MIEKYLLESYKSLLDSSLLEVGLYQGEGVLVGAKSELVDPVRSRASWRFDRWIPRRDERPSGSTLATLTSQGSAIESSTFCVENGLRFVWEEVSLGWERHCEARCASRVWDRLVSWFTFVHHCLCAVYFSEITFYRNCRYWIYQRSFTFH